jgi:hypothetical protein
MQMPPTRIVWLSSLVVGLLVLMGIAIERELAPRAAIIPAVTETSLPDQIVALTPDEETYAAALWPIHSEVVEASAVALSYAGVSYVTEHHDPHQLAAKVQGLHDAFKAVDVKAHALQVPASMQSVHDTYLEALALLKQASAEMLKVDQDGNVEHLIEAQTMTHRAAEDLLKVGDVLWPGEHKPN